MLVTSSDPTQVTAMVPKANVLRRLEQERRAASALVPDRGGMLGGSMAGMVSCFPVDWMQSWGATIVPDQGGMWEGE